MFSHGPPRNQAVACHHAQALDGGLGRHTAWTKMLYSELDFLCATIMVLSCGSCVKVTARHGAVKVLRARIFFFLSNNLIKRYRYSVFQSIFLHFLSPSKFQISQTGWLLINLYVSYFCKHGWRTYTCGWSWYFRTLLYIGK